jgi:hypothetical protein
MATNDGNNGFPDQIDHARKRLEDFLGKRQPQDGKSGLTSSEQGGVQPAEPQPPQDDNHKYSPRVSSVADDAAYALRGVGGEIVPLNVLIHKEPNNEVTDG